MEFGPIFRSLTAQPRARRPHRRRGGAHPGHRGQLPEPDPRYAGPTRPALGFRRRAHRHPPEQPVRRAPARSGDRSTGSRTRTCGSCAPPPASAPPPTPACGPGQAAARSTAVRVPGQRGEPTRTQIVHRGPRHLRDAGRPRRPRAGASPRPSTTTGPTPAPTRSCRSSSAARWRRSSTPGPAPWASRCPSPTSRSASTSWASWTASTTRWARAPTSAILVPGRSAAFDRGASSSSAPRGIPGAC